MSVYCPECDTVVPLPDELIAAGVDKIRCRQCGTRFRVLPGGHTLALADAATGGTLQPGSGSQGASSSGGFVSAGDTPSAASSGNSGPDGPNLTAAVGHQAHAEILAQARNSRLMDYPKLPVGNVFRQKYRIDAEIGQGASAVVYRAHDIDADIDMALKVVGVVGGQADGIRRAWAEEYKARRQVPDGSHLLGLESPQIEELDGTTYVGLPQELGEMTLRDWLREARSDIEQHREEALRLFTEICKGVEALHNSNLSHLDLKPENIILVKQGKDRFIAKVGDFGLARAAGSLSRREGTGTPAYMAPEQVRSAREKDIGPWSDIYALGCILFELLDGDAPFSGSSDELKDKHLNLPPPELEAVPVHLENLVMACLVKARKDRPAAVSELRQTMEINPEEEAAFKQASKTNTETGWEAFIQKWGDGRHGQAARTALEKCVAEREAKKRDETKRKEKENEERYALQVGKAVGAVSWQWKRVSSLLSNQVMELGFDRSVRGNYHVISELRRDMTGVLYKAIDAKLERFVAVKCLNIKLVDGGLEQVKMRLLSLPKHRHIAEIFLLGEEGGQLYFVMEYIDGESLAERLSRDICLVQERATRIVAECAVALSAAQQCSVIHFDINPKNILIDRHNRTVLTGFDGATVWKLNQQDEGFKSIIDIGTPGYLPPEVLMGQAADHRGDIYALGAVFYEMLTGERLIPGKEIADTAFSAIYSKLTSTIGQADEAAIEVLHKMLAKSPESRYQSYEELLADLGELA